jgi:hypothetical protein
VVCTTSAHGQSCTAVVSCCCISDGSRMHGLIHGFDFGLYGTCWLSLEAIISEAQRIESWLLVIMAGLLPFHQQHTA